MVATIVQVQNPVNVKVSEAVPIKVTNPTCPTVTDAGIRGQEEWHEVATLAVGAIVAAAEYKISEDMYKNALRGWKIAQERFDFTRNTYQPCEKKEVLESCTGTTTNKKEYLGRVAEYESSAREAFDSMTPDLGEAFNKYCLCYDKSIGKYLAIARDRMVGDTKNMVLRREESREKSKDETWFNRRLASMQRGRDLFNSTQNNLARATKGYEDYRKSWAEVSEGAFALASYLYKRRTGSPYVDSTINANVTRSDRVGLYSVPLGNIRDTSDMPSSITIGSTVKG